MRRCHRARKGLIGLPLPEEPEVDTVAKLLLRGAAKFPSNPCFGYRLQNPNKCVACHTLGITGQAFGGCISEPKVAKAKPKPKFPSQSRCSP